MELQKVEPSLFDLEGFVGKLIEFSENLNGGVEYTANINALDAEVADDDPESLKAALLKKLEDPDSEVLLMFANWVDDRLVPCADGQEHQDGSDSYWDCVEIDEECDPRDENIEWPVLTEMVGVCYSIRICSGKLIIASGIEYDGTMGGPSGFEIRDCGTLENPMRTFCGKFLFKE